MKKARSYRCIASLLLIVLLMSSACFSAGAQVIQSDILDTAFMMLEEGNVFLERYRAITGSDVQVYFENGLPYFFGGHSEMLLFSVYPQMRKHVQDQNSIYYKEGLIYLYGFDCVGYIRWIIRQLGWQAIPGLRDALISWMEYRDRYIYSSNSHLDMKMPAWEELSDSLQVGDFYIIKHGSSNHIMMYIGTLRDFGYTEAELPELAAYLDHPLVIHCSSSPAYAQRYQKVFDADYEYFKNCELPDGGVQISILGVPKEAIPYHAEFQKQEEDYFLVEGQIMTVVLQENVTSYCWFK